MSAGPGRVAMVMPPVTTMPPRDALAHWSTLMAACAALLADGRWTPTVHARHATSASEEMFDGVRCRFHRSDGALVAAVREERPDVVHVHGLGWARLLRSLRRVPAPIVLQHHGEPVFGGRAKWGHRLVRARVAGYLFTGASEGQAQPWIDAGVIRPDARLFEVLEAAPMLPDDAGPPVDLEGAPSILWVGRLIPGKDPLLAVDAFAAAGLPAAHLHLLATDRDLEPEVRARVAALGAPGRRVHLHPAVPHERMRAWYQAADLFLSTSHREGSGYSLLEAMSCGCTPVVSSIPPHRVIARGRGTQFSVGDVAAAAAAIQAAADVAREPIVAGSRSLHAWAEVAGQLADAYDALGTRELI